MACLLRGRLFYPIFLSPRWRGNCSLSSVLPRMAPLHACNQSSICCKKCTSLGFIPGWDRLDTSFVFVASCICFSWFYCSTHPVSDLQYDFKTWPLHSGRPYNGLNWLLAGWQFVSCFSVIDSCG